jgi:parvulin-like peptidyl-prolyl isomerase
MLQAIREQSKSGGTYILVALLIVVFAVFFGVPGDSCSGGAQRVHVATVAGEDIYSDDVNIVFNRVYGSRASDDEEEVKQQQADSLRALIIINLLAKRAYEQGLRVSEEELAAYIQDPIQNFEFQYIYGQSGKFDGRFYKAYVQNQLRISIPRYEEYKRTELLAKKYLALIEMQGSAPSIDVEEEARLKKTKVNLEFLKFDTAKLTEFVAVSDEEVTAFAAANDNRIKTYYTDNKADYESPEEVLIRRIFIARPDAEEGDDKVAEAKARWESAKKRVLEGGENFADVAGDVSEDYAKEKQGLMDWSTVENLDQNIAKAIKDASKGDVKEVETPFAWMLVKLEDRKEAKTTPLEDVRTDTARTLLQQDRVDEVSKQAIAEFKTAAKDAESFQAALDQLKANVPEGETSVWNALSVDETGQFAQTGPDLSAMFGGQFPGMAPSLPWDRIPKIGRSTPLAKKAFELTEGDPMPAQPYTVGEATYLVRLKERVEPSEEELDDPDIAKEVRSDLLTPVLAGAQFVFLQPIDDYGPLVESLYDDAYDKGVVKLSKTNKWDAISYVKTPDDVDAESESESEDGSEEGEKKAETSAG